MNLMSETTRRNLRGLAYTLLAIHFGVIIYIWTSTSLIELTEGFPSVLLSLGQLFGLMAAGCALLQFMLMGRSPWIEQSFGLERLAKLHRLNGYATITFILLHPFFLVMAYSMLTHVSPLTQDLNFFFKFEDVWKAQIAAVLYVAVVATTVWIVRKHLKYETWYWVHIMVYAAILLAFSHQIHVGGSFIIRPVFVIYWWALYLFVGLNVLIGRFLSPAYNYWRYGFRIEKVVPETHDTTSIYITGKNLERFKARPGQFVIIWILTKEFWLEEHPFSLSQVTGDGHLRITVKNVGDYTARIQHLKPGTKLVVSGPYGRFSPVPTPSPKRLYIAGGVGITPIMAMLQAQGSAGESVLVYGNKTVADTVFEQDLAQLAGSAHLTINHIYSEETNYQGETGRIDAARIERLVPDFRTREVFLCGPPPMMNGLITGLTAAGLPHAQLHFERFALHPIS